MNSQTHQGPPTGAVVVGIAPDGSDAALSFAAAEACRTHRPLHGVHVLQFSGAEAFAGVLLGAYEAADATLAQGLTRARELVDGQVPVTGERVDDGWLVADLVDRATRGSMLVLQHRRQSPLRRAVTGSIVAGVAGRCPVPVVSVPEGWQPGTADAVVTVGVQDIEEAGPLIRRGLLEARARDGRVEVLSAWHLEGGYDSVVADQTFRSERESRMSHVLAPALAAACREVPDVPARLRIEHDLPVEALLAGGRSSQLLVIGRRHHLLPLGSHLGPVARAVLQHSEAPVLLNPESPREVSVAVDDAATAPLTAQPAW
jgi:nucleotide-binding universal stress UspA family protein